MFDPIDTIYISERAFDRLMSPTWTLSSKG